MQASNDNIINSKSIPKFDENHYRKGKILTKRQLTKQQRRRIDQNQVNANAEINALEEVDQEKKCGDVNLEKYGTVIASYGKQVDVESTNTSKKEVKRCHLRANLPVIVSGDKVTWEDRGINGIVIAQHPRVTQICRPDNRGRIRPIAANIDRIAIVIAPFPEPHSNLIDRYIVASKHQSIQPFLILNKADLIETGNSEMPLTLVQKYKELGYDYFLVSTKNGDGMNKLETYLKKFTSVLVGQSGVGKSSLLNKLLPEVKITVGDLSESKKKGKHTTTTSRLFHLKNGGSVIDSPGIREFGLWHLDSHTIAEGFIEFSIYLGKCKFRNCNHEQDLGCALVEAVDAGKIERERFDSYLHIINSIKVG